MASENYILGYDGEENLLSQFYGADIHNILQYIRMSCESLNNRVKTISKELVLEQIKWNNNVYELNGLIEAEYNDFIEPNNYDAIISPSEKVDNDISYRETYNDYEIICQTQEDNGKLIFTCASHPDKDIKINVLYIYKPKLQWNSWETIIYNGSFINDNSDPDYRKQQTNYYLIDDTNQGNNLLTYLSKNLKNKNIILDVKYNNEIEKRIKPRISRKNSEHYTVSIPGTIGIDIFSLEEAKRFFESADAAAGVYVQFTGLTPRQFDFSIIEVNK